MEETSGCRPLLSLLLWVPLLGGVTAGDPRGGPRGGVPPPPSDDLLSRLGRATWVTLEGWVGSQPLGLVAESFSATLWLISSGISVALATTCGIVGDLLATAGVTGGGLVRTVALGPKEVQRVLLWAVATLVASWLLRRLRGLLQPALRWVKLCCFLGAFLHIAASPETPTAQAGMLLALGVLYSLLGGLGGGSSGSPPPSAQLEAAVRSLEWKVEELRRRQKWGGPRNREE